MNIKIYLVHFLLTSYSHFCTNLCCPLDISAIYVYIYMYTSIFQLNRYIIFLYSNPRYQGVVALCIIPKRCACISFGHCAYYSSCVFRRSLAEIWKTWNKKSICTIIMDLISPHDIYSWIVKQALRHTRTISFRCIFFMITSFNLSLIIPLN